METGSSRSNDANSNKNPKSDRKVDEFEATTSSNPTVHEGKVAKISMPAQEDGRLSLKGQNRMVASQHEETLYQPTPELKTFSYKLGWIQGVLVPCLLNIWGVMLFLRIAWVVAQAGMLYSLVIISLSCMVCLLTTLSLSAIVTNGKVQGGGIYYLISRSLGAELGASIGIIFAFANAVAATMNVIGFCESFNSLIWRWNWKIIDNDINDVRIIGAMTLLLLCVICAIGMDWESKFQNFLIVVIVLAIINYLVGVCIGPKSANERAQGFTGIRLDVAKNNLMADYRNAEGVEYGFFTVFAVYFPATTGVQSGANICGDLRDPAVAIPKGTLSAVLLSTIIYALMSICCAVAGLRDASGVVQHAYDLKKLAQCRPSCKYGLHNHYEIMQIMSCWELLTIFGCWAATISTALTNLLAVPRLIQALGQDNIYPGLIFFAKPYGPHGEPYRGYVLVYLVSATFLIIADLNTIAPLITNFYLASYALINFCTFHAALIKHISWRPHFRYYNKWLCFLGFLLCVGIMMIISWRNALLTVVIFLALYLIVVYRSPANVKWGSSTEAQKYRETVTYLVNLTKEIKAIKSYNPQLLVLSGRPYLSSSLIEFGNLITKLGSFMIVADIETISLTSHARTVRATSGQAWLNEHHYRSFYIVVDGLSLDQGVAAILQCTGLGHLSPNIFLIGYLHKWKELPETEVQTYFRTLQTVYNHHRGITILRSKGDEKLMPMIQHEPEYDSRETQYYDLVRSVLRDDSDELLNVQHSSSAKNSASSTTTKFKLMYDTHQLVGLSNDSDKIDAWWLFDDGGLNILIPYIISKRGLNHKIPLRIISFARPNDKEDEAYKRMAAVLQNFRIEFDELIILPSITNEPNDQTWEVFNSIIQKFKSESKIASDEELSRMHRKTVYYLCVRELIAQYCSQSTLIIVTLPLPKNMSAYLYMAWLDVLSQGLPTTVFIRGNNNTCVLDV